MIFPCIHSTLSIPQTKQEMISDPLARSAIIVGGEGAIAVGG
ncbi:hypothetical protein [Halothece sp. PCC 7418]|nr:hypothetical protein [Halothece sp. PCC 7418]